MRYKIADEIREPYYDIPKSLFLPPYDKLTNDARMLYGVLRDRLKLSQRTVKRHNNANSHKWVNKNGEIYIVYPQIELAKLLSCSRSKISRLMDSLIAVELLEVVHRGSQACYLYLGVPVTCKSAHQTCNDENPNVANPQVRLAPVHPSNTYRVYTDLSNTERGDSDSNQIKLQNNKKAPSRLPASPERKSAVENAFKRYRGTCYESKESTMEN